MPDYAVAVLLVHYVQGGPKKVKVPILIVERRGPELIPDSRQSACR